MTLVAMNKKCPTCHRLYQWNPDVGKFTCPYCRRKVLRGYLKKWLKKKRKDFCG